MADDSDDEDGEKPHEPTARRLEEAHDRGDVPKSTEIVSAAALAIAAAMVGSFGSTLAAPQLEMFRDLWSHDALLRFQSGAPLWPPILLALAKTLLPLLAALALAGLFIGLAQLGFRIPSGEEAGLKVDFGRLDVVRNAKEIFGTRALIGGAKNLLKLAVVAGVMVSAATDIFQRKEGYLGLPPAVLIATAAKDAAGMLGRLALVMAGIALADYGVERYRHHKRLRMTQAELKQENKASEGDPHIKAARKRKARELATKRPVQAAAKATVVIANPTHFCVALQYRRGQDQAPIVLGKGKDRIALRMREAARNAGVPIVEDKPLARALYAVAKEGRAIPVDFYNEVAQVLASILNPQRPVKPKPRGRGR